MTDPVLLLLDFQEDVCRENGAIGRSGVGAQVAERGVLGAAAGVLAAFRDRDLPVIFVRVAFDAEYTRMTSASPRFTAFREHRMMLADDPATAICAEVAPRPDEPVIDKGCVSPFVGTSLASKLIALGATNLVIGGVATNHVVEAAARTGADMGYRVCVLEDLCASFTPELHEFSVINVLPVYGRVTTSHEEGFQT